MIRLLQFILLPVAFLLIGFFSIKLYAKHLAKNCVPQANLKQLIENIKTAPPLPDKFKETYTRVYPEILNENFTSSSFYYLLGRRKESCPSRQSAYFSQCFFSDYARHFKNKLSYAGLVWLIEENTSQEKCFEYNVSRFDFLNSAISLEHASQFYFKKPADSLSLDEQLIMILKLKNPACFNQLRYPERCDKAVKELRERIVTK